MTLQANVNKVSPRWVAGRRYASPADGSSTAAYRFVDNQAISTYMYVKTRRIYVRPRTGPQSAHLW